eukprot:Gb_20244 [translate_table: standard]
MSLVSSACCLKSSSAALFLQRDLCPVQSNEWNVSQAASAHEVLQ